MFFSKRVINQLKEENRRLREENERLRAENELSYRQGVFEVLDKILHEKDELSN